MQLSQVLRHVQQLTVGGHVVVIPPAAFVRLDESSRRTVSRLRAILVFFSRFIAGSSGGARARYFAATVVVRDEAWERARE
jgi:hypothetical protein